MSNFEWPFNTGFTVFCFQLLGSLFVVASIVCMERISGDSIVCMERISGDSIVCMERISGDSIVCMERISGDSIVCMRG